MSHLNSKKAADEQGLTAEHVKYSGRALIHEITDIFNNIVSEGKVPQLFKTGILTPVLKKSKDSTILDNYRGITVTLCQGNFLKLHSYQEYLKTLISHLYSLVLPKDFLQSCRH